jgi:hypothetical protein
MMKTLLFSNYSLSKPALPFVISTGGVMGLCPLKVMKNGFCSATTLNGSAALPFVISTGAKRSGEICGPAVLSWKYFRPEESWAFAHSR